MMVKNKAHNIDINIYVCPRFCVYFELLEFVRWWYRALVPLGPLIFTSYKRTYLLSFLYAVIGFFALTIKMVSEQ